MSSRGDPMTSGQSWEWTVDWLRNLLSVRTVPTNGAFALEEDKKGAFVTVAALASFPVASGVVTILWKVVALTGIDVLEGRGGIALAAAIVGFVLWASTSTAKGNWRVQASEVGIGVINTALLFAAAVGIDVTVLGGTGGA